MDFLALVTTGFWPVISVRSATAPSSSDGCWVALPTPMLMHDLLEARHLHDVVELQVGP